MEYRIICTFFLLFIVLNTVSAADNTTSADIGEEVGIVRIPSIVLTIDASGIVYVQKELIVRKGDVSRILLPSNVQGLEILDSNKKTINYEKIPRGEKQLIAFVVEDGTGNKSEETVSIEYNTQQLTGKFGDIWEINYSATVTPIGSSTTGTVLKLYTPQNTQITKIEFKDFYWSPMGGSEIEIYPTTKDFNLYFQYKLGVSGPLIPRPNETTSTTIPQTTTTNPSTIDYPTVQSLINQINNIYYLLVFGIILSFLLGAFALVLRHKRLKEQLKPKESVPKEEKTEEIEKTIEKNAVDTGAIFSVESVNHDFEVLEPKEDVKEIIEEKEELVDSPKKPHKAVLGPRRLKESVRNVLDETELKVVDMLLKFEEEITQAYIYKTTGIPKSSLSDTIKRLEKRNIIERKREGRINWIKLKEAVLE